MNILTMLTLALLLTSASALQAACPDLAGDYICQGKCDYEANISQSMDGDGITTYTTSWTLCQDSHGQREKRTKTLIADGIYRNSGNLRFKGQCSEDGILEAQGTIGGKYHVRESVGFTTGGELEIKSTLENLETGKIKSHTVTCHPRSM